MPIIKKTKADNGASIEYHKVKELKANIKTNQVSVSVESFATEEAASAGNFAVWNQDVTIDSSVFSVPSSLLDVSEAVLVAAGGWFEGGTIVSDNTDSLESLKYKKNAEINTARLQANRGHFVFSNKDISCDELSRSDIDAANGIISLTGEMPDNWPGGWKALDNTYVAIPDVEVWKSFYKAMVDKGIASFRHAQDLKQRLEEAQTQEEVRAINWGDINV